MAFLYEVVMFPKNLILFKLTESFSETTESLNEKLQPAMFKPCGDHQESSSGFVPPIGTELVYSNNGYMMVCLQTETKVMPSAAINKLFDEKVAEREEAEGRKLSRKEKVAIKDEIIFEQLPKALTTINKTYAYIDANNGFIVVDASSSNKAEAVLSLLRICLGSLPCVPLTANTLPKMVMTNWLIRRHLPSNVTIGDVCKLELEEIKVNTKNLDLYSSEIEEHLNAGLQVVQLAIEFDNRLSFIITESLHIKRLKFLDLAIEDLANQDLETPEQRFDAESFITTHEISNLIYEVGQWFGGFNH